jgi:N-acetylmuramoyl-L-alanine amidase CwlA
MSQQFSASGMPPMIGKCLSIPEWNTYVASYDFGPIAPKRLVLHHTWKPTVAQWRGLASMRGMQTYYAGLGWTAAPHIYCAPDGIWLFTPMSNVGIHAGSGNSGTTNGVWWYSIGLEMVGNYDYERPSGAVWENTKAVIGELSKRVDVAPRNFISFHRDYGPKSCPGWAVTHEWVWSEIEAYLNNAQPPEPPAPGEIGNPTPDEEQLLENLLMASYSKRARGYTSEWAFHEYAVTHDMGMPIAKSARMTVDGKEYNYQPFARDTLYCEIPKWGDVQLLSELLGGSIPPHGLGRELLEQTYKACGATFHADWASHQYAMSAKLGPPLAEGSEITVDGVRYGYQVFARDTLFFPIPQWTNISLLSTLSGTKDATKKRLREALLAAIYKSCGTTYHPEWAFHQLAHTLEGGGGIGAPLSNSERITVGGKQYAIQVYTLDTLYNEIPHWSNVKRLKDLIQKSSSNVSFGMVSFSVGETLPEVEGQWEPPAGVDLRVEQVTPPSPSREDRDGAQVSLVIIHGDDHPATEAIENMTELGARQSCHYYVTKEGTIYSLVPEDQAAWHSGMATMGGLWFNTNRISIGVMLEAMPAQLEPTEEGDPGGMAQEQRESFLALLKDLVDRYRFGPDDIILGESLIRSGHVMPTQLLERKIAEASDTPA